jgi:predicted S18 family serine protease
MGSIRNAFQFAMDRLAPSIRPTGTLSLYSAVAGPMTREGPGTGAALAIGFLALLKGDALIQGITITGTLEATGRIGPTAHIEEKAKAAANAGYRVLLVPPGQFYAPRASLVSMRDESKVLVYEVGSIDEAYKIMTGKKL